MNIIVEIRDVYGQKLIYPVNEAAHNFCKLTNKKTLSGKDLKIIMSLGFEIVVSPSPMPTIITSLTEP